MISKKKREHEQTINWVNEVNNQSTPQNVKYPKAPQELSIK
nr:MAG TPA: hypothetical protein [Caudoviricetes sp.]DAX84391.1 MAG TPA: hypothetical protein [Caudoviricetes sp.]